MVNPVLLGAIPGNEGNISVVGAPTALQGSITQELVVLDVKSGDSVWVIDGQHRINGMKIQTNPCHLFCSLMKKLKQTTPALTLQSYSQL